MRAYGFDADRSDVLDDAEAAIIREIADRIVLGEPLLSIVRNLNARGVLTAYGRTWDGSTIRKLMTNSRICGRPVGRSKPVPAIISPQLYEAVQAVLSRPERRIRLTNAHRYYVATGWLRCGRCGSVMPPKGGVPPSYACNTRAPYKGCGRMRINSGPVDDYIVAKVLARIARADVRAAIAESASAVHGGWERIDELADRIKKAIRDNAEPEIVRTMESELGALVAEYRPVAHWSQWFATPGNITPDNLAQWWTDADTRRRQDLLSCMLDHIDVKPMPHGGTATAKDRLEFIWLI